MSHLEFIFIPVNMSHCIFQGRRTQCNQFTTKQLVGLYEGATILGLRIFLCFWPVGYLAVAVARLALESGSPMALGPGIIFIPVTMATWFMSPLCHHQGSHRWNVVDISRLSLLGSSVLLQWWMFYSGCFHALQKSSCWNYSPMSFHMPLYQTPCP